jgi:hypothetical protein
LTIKAKNSTIKGLVINRFTYNGIIIDGAGATGNVISGNFIGTDVTGTVALGNGIAGVFIERGASSNRVGTDGNGIADTAERNVISGNGYGVLVHSSGANNNVIAGNYIGTAANGNSKVPNNIGVEVRFGPKNTRIGTDGSNDQFNSNERNVISGNNWNGVQVWNPDYRTGETISVGIIVVLHGNSIWE